MLDGVLYKQVGGDEATYLVDCTGEAFQYDLSTQTRSSTYYGELAHEVRKHYYPLELLYGGVKFMRVSSSVPTKTKPANKYGRLIINKDGDKMIVDVYDVIEAFAITCPAISHAAKKVLCGGLRGHKDQLTDIQDVIDSMERAKQLHKNREVL